MFKIEPKYQPGTMALANAMLNVIGEGKQPINGRFSLINNKAVLWVKTAVKIAGIAIAIAFTYVYEKGREYYLKRTRVKEVESAPEEDVRFLFGEEPASNYENSTRKQINDDISTLTRGEHKAVKNACTNLIANEYPNSVQGSLSDNSLVSRVNEKAQKYIDRGISIYASSKEQYAPVVLDYVHSLLETALTAEPPKRLVFMARDGTAFYKVAKILQNKFPERYGKVLLSHVYTSRNVVSWATKSEANTETFRRYLKSKGLNNNESCIFVDIGFEGSKIADIKRMLEPVTQNIEFSFFISINSEVNGFVADINNKLAAVPKAGQNLAVHWLEDTHQGVLNSPTHLVVCHDGEVKPNSKVGFYGDEKTYPIPAHEKATGKFRYKKITCKETKPSSYIYKTMGLRAVLDYAEKSDKTTPFTRGESEAIAFRKADAATKDKLDSFLLRIRSNERRSFVKHI